MPLVSVIVPVRNGERHLPECLASILSQTLTDLEVIVVDDDSSDSTAQIIDQAAAGDPRVRRLPGPATGSAGDARNAGIEVAAGDYLAFWDGDDRFGPTLLSDLHAQAVAEDADIVLTKFRIADERTGIAMPVEWGIRLEYFPTQSPVAPEELGDFVLIAVNPAPWNKLFRTDFVRASGLRFQSLHRANDVSFMSLAMVHAERLSYLDSYAIDYRVGTGDSLQATRDENPLEFVDALAAVRRGLKRSGHWPALRRAMANLTVELSLTALRKAGSSDAFALIHRKLRDEVFPRFGVAGQPDDYFLRPEYPRQVAAIMQHATAELLFDRLTAATHRVDLARAEARSVLLGMGAPPVRPEASAPPIAAAAPATPDGDQPDVTVVIPVYNTERYLRECLESVQRQTGVDLQILCVEDGSVDGSPRLLQQIADQDPRIQIVHQEHAGLSVGRNTALAHATGRYVCFLDSDDSWRLDGLAELVRQADADALDLLAFDAETVRAAGMPEQRWQWMTTYYERPGDYREPVTGPRLLTRMQEGRHYRVSACLYLVRRQLLVDHDLRFYPGITGEDNLFTFATLLAAQRAAHVPTRLYSRLLRPGSTVTGSSRAITARGYFVCAVEMQRLVQGRQFEPEVAAGVAAAVHRAIEQARDQAVRLSPDLIAGLGALYPEDPDAQVLIAAIAKARLAAQRGARAPKPPATPLRRAVRKGRRLARGALRRARSLLGSLSGR